MKISGGELFERLVLDTSTYSWMRSGHEDVLDRVAAAEVVSIPTVVLGELEGAFELGSRAGENRRILMEFLDEPFVSILPITPAIARQYGRIFASLRKRGRPIPVNDMWIAATTIDCGGHLLSFDTDFERIEHLDCTILEA